MDKILQFLEAVGRLKRVKRSGWVFRNVPNPESVADHAFRNTVLALVFANQFKVNKEKLLKMAIIEDLGEAVIGDITPHEYLNEKDKLELEKNAVKQLSALLPNGYELFALWTEYNERKTPEARLVYQLDKLEMLIQAFEYEKHYPEKKLDLDEFWGYCKKRISDPKLVAYFKLLSKKRKLLNRQKEKKLKKKSK